ncbi:uncharacterized protein [Primulina eburnea]|uniref:uncharacterized protein n=1 Tax=Primulina eburnea TaxID=1245227 RepID=UPI003C6C040A
MEASTNIVFRPPVLDGSNYALWKVKMRVFIKSIEERAWQRVFDGWSPPKIEDADGDTRLKPESTWTIDEVQNSNFNSKALNAIFLSVDTRMFNLITNCVCAREAWDILQKHCEGSESVRKTRLKTVASKFESLRMEDKESILEYDSRLRQLSNEAHSLGDPMSNERLVNKVLRYLPERFNVKVCAIKESKDTSTINLYELMSSLRTFEMNLDLQKKDKGKTIALEVSTDSYDEILQISKEKKKIGQKSVLPNITTSAKALKFNPMKGQFRPRNELRIQSNFINLDSVQCRECSEFGHYANECANRLRKNKGMDVTLSDEESDEDQGSYESEKHTSLSAVIKEKCLMQINPLGVATCVAIPGRNISSNSVCLNSTTLGESSQSKPQEVDDDEVTLESVQTIYEELYGDWIKINKVNAILSKENSELKSNISRLEVILSKKDLELCKVKEDLGEATQIIAKLNSSSSKLDSLLMIGKNDKAGLGYTNNLFEIGESSNTERKPTVFVKESVEISNASHTEKGVSSKKQISTKKSKSRKRHFICHYCFRLGHIKPYCFKLRDDYKRWESEQVLPQTNIARIWYFDSGCSRHMTGIKDHLIDYVELRNGHVTYGGDAKRIIAGKRTLNVDFDKDNCEVFDNTDTCILTGTRSAYNCYQIGEDFVCNHSKVSELNLWHQNLGHANFKTLKNLGKYDAARGIPNLSSGISYVCGARQKSKQTRVPHQVLQHYGTTRCLELLYMDLTGPMEVESLGSKKYSFVCVPYQVLQHNGTTRCLELLNMDIMGPMEVESLGGKKYSFVCVDDFSRFTWVSFLREKSDTFTAFKTLHAKITNLHDLRVDKIRTDHGKEFENSHFTSFCEKRGINHEFSAPKTPQQNGIAERKNRILQEMARVMLSSKNISKRFWAEALNTACHISNLVYLRSGSTMTSYEIILGKRPKLKYFHFFGCVCYVLNDRDHLAKFDSKSDKCIFLGYSSNSRAYRMYNLRTRTTMKSINVVFDDLADLTGKTIEDDVDGLLNVSETLPNTDVVPGVVTPETTPALAESNDELGEEVVNDDDVINEGFDIPSKIQKNHPSSQIIGEAFEGMQTRRKKKVDYRKMIGLVCMTSMYQADPKVTHLKAVKRILRYIAGTLDLGLWYTKETNTDLVGFSDDDWAGNLDDRKSTTGGCFYLGNNLVSWYSRKQNYVSLSTAESEYVAAASCCSQLLWMNQMIKDYEFNSDTLIMADFDPHDIRSEMAASMHRESHDSTPTAETNVGGLEIVGVPEEPTLLEVIAPGEPGNEINVENPPDFETLNKAFPPAPMRRRSKRQVGFDPDFVPTKKPRASTSSNLLDPDFSSGDDSDDDDFELVARPKPTVAAKKGKEIQALNSHSEPLNLSADEMTEPQGSTSWLKLLYRLFASPSYTALEQPPTPLSSPPSRRRSICKALTSPKISKSCHALVSQTELRVSVVQKLANTRHACMHVGAVTIKVLLLFCCR